MAELTKFYSFSQNQPMKPLYLAFTILFTLSTFFASAQLFTSNQERVYGAENLINVTIDSAAYQGDSIFFPSHNWLVDDGSFCYSPDSVSVLGKEIHVTESNVYQFFLIDGDTLILDTEMEFVDSMMVYISNDGALRVQAKVTAVADEVVFEEIGTETVKTFALQVLDDQDEPIASYLNNFYFKIGSASGLVSFPSLKSFPHFGGDPVLTDYQLDLRGISPGPGVKDLSTFDVFDFQPGDEVHYEEGSSSFGDVTSMGYALEYLNRTDYTDSIVYEVEVSTYLNGSSEPTEVFTEMRTVVKVTILETPAGQPVLLDSEDLELQTGDVTSLRVDPTIGRAKVANSLGPLYYFSPEEGCYTQIIDNTCFQDGEAYYYEGLGGPYFQCVNGPTSSSWSTLLYFNKSGEEWGSPLQVSNAMAEKFAIYPNPTSSQFSISHEGNPSISAIRLFDLSGRVVREYGVNRVALSLDGISSGIYGVEITFDSGSSATQKLIVP